MRALTRPLCWLALACALAGPAQAAAPGPKQVVLLLSDAADLYQETAQAIRAGLESGAGGKLTVRLAVAGEPAAQNLAAAPDTLVVPIGLKAAQFASKRDNPTLAVLLARQSYEVLAGSIPPAATCSARSIWTSRPPVNST